MTIETVKRPYELLVRWDESTGELRGAHVAFQHVTIEDGQIVAVSAGKPIPIALAGEGGFPLADILGATESSALARASELETENTALKARLDILEAAVSAVKSASAAWDQSVLPIMAQTEPVATSS